MKTNKAGVRDVKMVELVYIQQITLNQSQRKFNIMFLIKIYKNENIPKSIVASYGEAAKIQFSGLKLNSINILNCK